MRAGANIISLIESHRGELRRSERKVAEFTLKAPQAVTGMNLSTLAGEADVSEPTVIRFCRAMGCKGFADFKLRLAESLGAGAAYVHREIQLDDDIPEIAAKVFSSSINTLAELRDGLGHDVLEEATQALAQAQRIDCYGVGLASVAAIDAHQKFIRLGVVSSICADAHLQTMSAATLGPGDVALVFSYTGQIKDIARSAQVARESGATVIGVTRTGSRLSRICSLTIAVDPVEDTFVYAPMTTRLAHLAIVDILATSVALRRGPEVPEQLRRIKSTLRDQWILEPDAAHQEELRELSEDAHPLDRTRRVARGSG